MPAIDISDLSYTYPGATAPALDTISLQVQHGDFIGLIGANNAGKSSLCYAMAGVIPHLYHGHMVGRVRVHGKDTAESSVAETAVSIAFVMQKPENQLSGVCFTVREEVAFTLENRGVARAEMVHRVDNALNITGLTQLADRSPHHLSGGQLQKVILASALASDAPILVLDEPTTFLDPQGTRQLFEILHRLRLAGKTIVIAEQRLEYLAQYANRIIALHHGKKKLDGPSREVLTAPMLKTIGLDWTRFTTVADRARNNHLWPNDTPLPTTLAGTVRGFKGE